MHADHEVFLEAIASKKQVKLSFFHAKEQKEMTLVCAPLDFGPLRGALDQSPRYQLWDLEAKRPPFNVTAMPEDIQSIEMLELGFDPAAIIKWKFKPNAWTVVRDWEAFS
jgi:hypothetical protein